MDTSEETLNAFVDGELPPQEMERIALLLTTRPDLEAYVTQQETLRTHLRMNDVLAAPVPQHLIDAVKTTPISWRWRLRQMQWLSPRALVPAGAALALGLAVGLVLKPASDIASSNGAVIAHGALASALDNKLAGAGYDSNGARIGISFRNRAGQDCRTFTAGNLAGLACHQGSGWTVATLVTTTPEASGGYRMAGSQMPDAVRQAAQAQIDGAPFDAAAEAQARARGWAGK
jgi:hypothetical protein